ncbi:uncharacterized protein YALI1_C07223g [Yarrowia lipolytica]|uniref:Uncharacterized protein n=1 Tax=Yarrowia lipolytica TaxID=4952 RepID=A0A1D8N9T0_YARLL|nr:hypothetical protein YALI1_C07223g [Yarrowia lipolytica]
MCLIWDHHSRPETGGATFRRVTRTISGPTQSDSRFVLSLRLIDSGQYGPPGRADPEMAMNRISTSLLYLCWHLFTILLLAPSSAPEFTLISVILDSQLLDCEPKCLSD